MKTTAAVLVETKKPVELAELELPALKPGQAIVEIAYSGVCHTQLLECRGYRGEDKFLPHLLGHEGSGIVRETGPGIQKVKAGDRVVLSWIKGSGADIPGAVYRWGDRSVNAGAITTFGRFSVISENRLTSLPKDLPLREAALLGCAVPTGFGTVFNTAKPMPGQSMVIFGMGGIGLCALSASAVAGCVPIIAVDIRPEKLELAKQMGATHVLNAAQCDPVAEVARLVPGGTDFAVESSGRPAAMRQALLAVRQQGGTAVIVGNVRHGENLEIDPKQLNLGKRLLGTWGGDNTPDRDYPRYARLLSSGKVDLSPMLSKVYPLEQINAAIDDLEAGRAIRPLIEMGAQGA
ncbi:MAG: zinc-binding dehydrogenase [Elusimicrobia bacterium]|nr:zinc-binding dehydrogenase [Elusimicrobiota bacterium]